MFKVQARQFFEDRIIQQAVAESVPLSVDERLMLKWSESEPEGIGDPALAERLASEISDEDYEEKIVQLLARSYATDVARDTTAQKTWGDAFRALQEEAGDYYIGIIVDRALARQLTPWWKFRWL